jgi:hypothetical protein
MTPTPRETKWRRLVAGQHVATQSAAWVASAPPPARRYASGGGTARAPHGAASVRTHEEAPRHGRDRVRAVV